jgi:predicted RNase H-like HicB family nuclease
MRVEAIAYPEKEGGYSVSIPALDIWTQGETLEECRFMAADAVTAIFETEFEDKNFEGKIFAHSEQGNSFTLSVPPEETLQLMLKLLRSKQGLSLSETTKILGYSSKNSFAQYEQGTREPGVAKFAQMLEGLQCDLVLSVRSK